MRRMLGLYCNTINQVPSHIQKRLSKPLKYFRRENAWIIWGSNSNFSIPDFHYNIPILPFFHDAEIYKVAITALFHPHFMTTSILGPTLKMTSRAESKPDREIPMLKQEFQQVAESVHIMKRECRNRISTSRRTGLDSHCRKGCSVYGGTYSKETERNLPIFEKVLSKFQNFLEDHKIHRANSHHKIMSEWDHSEQSIKIMSKINFLNIYLSSFTDIIRLLEDEPLWAISSETFAGICFPGLLIVEVEWEIACNICVGLFLIPWLPTRRTLL